MIKVKGFPGPLYPLDHPEGPSPDSDFVRALKRTLGRLGAWPWDPDGWDNSYSLWFAHGDGWGHPTHAGIEGIQHWSGTLSPTGSTGRDTFNFLRSVKIGQGLPHAGEMAMDSVCVNLINSAYDDANPTLTMSVREAALKRAIAEIGTTENPPESNVTRYGEWYGEPGVPWCAIFATYCYEHAADDLFTSCDSFVSLADSNGNDDRWDYVPWIVSDARNGRYGLSVTSSPKPGDLVCYDWGSSGGDGTYDHVGLFEEWKGGSEFTAIEGNTSVDNNSNGGQVMRRTRDRNAQGTVFVRVAE